MPYRAYPNGQGGIARECMPPGYKAAPGEVLFDDPPTDEQLAAAFPGFAPPPPPPSIEERVAALEAENGALKAALVKKALVTDTEIETEKGRVP